MALASEKAVAKHTDEAQKIRKQFNELLARTNKEQPSQKDIRALANLLMSGNESLKLWRSVASAGYVAELSVIENATTVAGVKECWKRRLQALKRDLGYNSSPTLEQLLIQHTALCWLKLNIMELTYAGAMKRSITLSLGMYWEKRLSAAQKRFTRACETLARVRRLSRNTPALQFNIATNGGQQEPHKVAPQTLYHK